MMDDEGEGAAGPPDGGEHTDEPEDNQDIPHAADAGPQHEGNVARRVPLPQGVHGDAIIENDELRHRFQKYMEASEFSEGHLFAYLSVAAAYSHGTEWLDQVVGYIKGNVDFTETYLKEHIPAIKMIRPQASYLIFLDCRELGLNQDQLNRLFVEDAHLALNDGTTFGKEGEGFMRLNIACPRAVLEQALKQLEQAVRNLK